MPCCLSSWGSHSNQKKLQSEIICHFLFSCSLFKSIVLFKLPTCVNSMTHSYFAFYQFGKREDRNVMCAVGTVLSSYLQVIQLLHSTCVPRPYWRSCFLYSWNNTAQRLLNLSVCSLLRVSFLKNNFGRPAAPFLALEIMK